MRSTSRRGPHPSRHRDEAASASSSVRAERQADRIADAVARGGAVRAGVDWSAAAVPNGTIQRKCADCAQEEQKEQASRETSPAIRRDAGPLLAEDEGDVGPGQMRKSEFLAALRVEICASVDEAMSDTGRDSKGCPWIDHWLGYYAGRGAAQVERALRRYAPEAATATTARDYIPLVAARVRRSADTYAATGEIAGIPDDITLGGMVGGGMLSVFGGMFFKARPGGVHASAHTPAGVRSQLGAGRPLQEPVRTRMELAYGASLSRVRLHTDNDAARLSDQLNARAFAVGEHVAFGAGEYRPGTLAGDALIAHELAHVVQQGGAAAPMSSVQTRSEPASTALERDADRAAAGAVAGMWGRSRGAAAGPRLRSGLSLSRCSSKAPSRERKPILLADCPAISDADWKTSVAAAQDDEAKRALIATRLCKSTVVLAGGNCPTQEFPTDYQPASAINFDPQLNRKQRFSSRRNCDGTKKRKDSGSEDQGPDRPEILRDNFGHSFRAGKEHYVVLGPGVLEKGPLEPKRAAEHELYHVAYHLDKPETKEEAAEHELETHVQDFKKYFSEFGSMKRGPVDEATKTQPDIYFGPSWGVLDGYYQRTPAERRKLYLADLVEYYKDSPPPRQLLFREWMKRHDDFQIVKDLKMELKL
jgi:Domain of unknown function (DUF4157)